MKGEELPADDRDAWEWLRNPLPAGCEDSLFAALRLQLGLPDQVFFTDRGYGSLGFFEQQAISQTLAPGFFQEHNPLVRHTVLRRRQTLEEAGLLEKVGVEIHPEPDAAPTTYPGVGFSGLGLLTNHPFDLAYQAAEAFTTLLQQRTKAAGFMKTLLLQRICSSFASGRATAERMLRRESPGDEEEDTKSIEALLSAITPDEATHLRTIVEELSRPEARDPETGRRPVLPRRASLGGKDLAGTRLHHLQPVLRHRVLGRRGVGQGDPRRAGRRLCRPGKERPVSRGGLCGGRA